MISLLATALALPQEPAPIHPKSLLTVERVVRDATLRPRRVPAPRWSEGHAYEVLDEATLRSVDASTGASGVLVPEHRFVPAGDTEPLAVEDWSWSEDRTKLLVLTNSRRVWRRNTRGDFWLVDLARDDAPPTRIGAGAPPSSLQFAKLSPSGDRVAYVHANDLYVQDVDSGRVTRLTDDGSATTIHGTFDWVYEEEFGLRDGFRWSPDGTHLAYWKLDATGVGTFRMVDNLDGIYPRVVEIPYPKAGTTNSACRIGVIPADGGETVWMDTPGDPRETYLARMEWTPAGDALLIQHLNRRQDHLRLLLADPASGAVRVAYEERDEAWIDVRDDHAWIEDGRALLWVSERDGWRHAWRLPLDGGEPELVTHGDWDVVELLHVDEARGYVDVAASPGLPTRLGLFRVDLAGGGPVRLTPVEYPGWNTYSIAPDGTHALHTWSRFEQVPSTQSVALPDHEPRYAIEDNEPAQLARERLARGAWRFERVPVEGGVELDAWLMLPPDFDPSKRWPVLFHVYGEPAGTTVRDAGTLGNHLWHWMLTQRGYVVASVDNRGTPAPRGREWRKCVNGAIGVLASRDQAAALRALRERHAWIDPDRVGMWGWSGGGSMTLNMLFRHPELYACGIAVAAVPDQRLYDTIYQERYMGRPQDNEEGYLAGSPIHFAAGLEDPLLLVHGTLDDNVHHQGFEQLVDELVALEKPFEMLAYPGRSHGIHERPGTRAHLFASMTRFLERELPPGPR